MYSSSQASRYIIIVFLIINCWESFTQNQNSSSQEDYQRAQYFINPNQSKVYEAYVSPNWINGGDAFWYEKKGINKTEYFLVEPKKKSKKQLFNLHTLANRLQELSSDTIDPNDLTISNLKYNSALGSIKFQYNNISYIYNISKDILEVLSQSYSLQPTESLSPDGKFVAFVKNYNLFIKEVATGEEIQLTHDGEKYFAYATTTETNLAHVTTLRKNWPVAPVLEWSNDSKKILTHQLDERKVESTHLLQMVDTDESLRPILYTYKFPVPSDSIIPLAYPVVIDIEKKRLTKLDVPPFNATAATPLDNENKRIWWNSNEMIEAIWQNRCFNEIQYLLINTANGSSEILISEKDNTLLLSNVDIFSKPNVKYLSSGEFIWFSERSGFGNIYLYDQNKRLKNKITSGDYVVREIIWIDEINRQVYFTATGKEKGVDPYFMNFYKVDFNGRNIKLLTPENADQRIKLSSNHSYFISNNAWNGLPTSIVRDIDGKFLMDLESSDFTSWTDKGWQLPERVKMLAGDGVTETYGVIFKPTNFKQSNIYPILDDVYPGPQRNRVHYIGYDGQITPLIRHQSAIAELGFIVINMDGRGTTFRSKKFFNYSYNDLGVGGGLIDHVVGIKQLSEKLTYIDTSRVGIFGHSGGGYASTRALLEFPDFYKVAVSSAGNHDSRGYISVWMDLYMCEKNPTAYEDQSNFNLVNNLKGKLMLMTGDLDDNVHPSMTINLVDALIKANKDFDFLIIPNTNHGNSDNSYFIRKRWDYFYKNLLGKEPPKNFKINYD